jgi:hypothetical protein
MRDEQGAALPCLTTAQHDAIVQRMLTAVALEAIKKATGPRPELRADVQAAMVRLVDMIVRQDPTAAYDWDLACSRANSIERVVMADAAAGALVTDLRTQFALFVPMPAIPGDRRVLKFSMEVAVDSRAQGREGPVARLGRLPRSKEWVIDVPIAGRASSFHIEVPSPDELLVANADLLFSRNGTPFTRRDERDHIRQPTSIAHLHPAVPERGTAVQLKVGFILRRDGLATSGALVALSTTALLIGGLILHAAGVAALTDAAGAVIVALPAIFAPLLFVSSAHRLVRGVVGAIRMLVLFSAALSFAAAASLAAALPDHDRARLWLALWIASLPCSLLLTHVWWRSPGRQRLT